MVKTLSNNMLEAQAPIGSPMNVNLRKYVLKLDRVGPVDKFKEICIKTGQGRPH